MSELFRELTAEEIAFVAGGDIVVTGHRISSGYNFWSWGWSSGDDDGGGWDTRGSEGDSSDPLDHVSFNLMGVDCGLERENFENALSTLMTMSPSARALIGYVIESGYDWKINLVNTGVDETFLATTQINWDPYGAINVVDAQGNVIGHQSAMIGLAHEFAEAYSWKLVGAAKDAQVMMFENAIIDEINAYLGVQQETHRASHADGLRQGYIAASSTSTTQVSQRPQCS